MARLLGILVLILSIVLFPPAALALISNNAVPGDAAYPIKRMLEDVIFAVASINPTSRAWFAAARSDRRFDEVTVLIKRRDDATETLKELIDQTDSAAYEIDKVGSSMQKRQLLDKLSKSIQKYDDGLKEVSKPKEEIPVPQVSPTPQPSRVIPTPAPWIDELERQRREVDEARRKLEEIKRRIQEEQRRLEEEERTRQAAPDLYESSPSPSPLPSPSPSIQPFPSPLPSPSRSLRRLEMGTAGYTDTEDEDTVRREEPPGLRGLTEDFAGKSDVSESTSSGITYPSPSPSSSPSP